MASVQSQVLATAGDQDDERRYEGAVATATLGALGVVFGDIGTSPLYALQAAIAALGAPPTADQVTGVVSLVIWALTLVVSIKYVTIVMRADNDGEGGILALLALAGGDGSVRRGLPLLVLVGVAGAALLYGDGTITPAISVLSAVEGLKVEAPALAPWVVPITLVILVGLFAVQSRGTGSLGRWFGPIMLVWFAGIALLGLRGLVAAPQILAALSPLAGAALMAQQPGLAVVVFGLIFLALTGAEALYADMGHFGARPIRIAWFAVVYPALILNYLGQGGLLLATPAAADNPFYKLVPQALLVPVIVLAAAATVIASQALISGAFSLTRQAIAERLMPRMTVRPTSGRSYGQIYVPMINWLLMVATIAVVLAFRSSDALASAYGIAVAGTMLATTLLLFRVARDRWRWPLPLTVAIVAGFGVIDAAFFSANLVKFLEGGWLPLAIGAVAGLCMIAWRVGIVAVRDRLEQGGVSFEAFLAKIDTMLVARLPGCGVFVTRLADHASPMLVHHVRHNRVLHEHVVLLTVEPTRRPRVPAGERLTVLDLGHGFHRVIVKIGFMQRPDIPTALRTCAKLGYGFCRDDLHYYIAHEALVRRKAPPRLPGLLWLLFNVMHGMSLRAADYFQLPPAQVMEVGFRLEI